MSCFMTSATRRSRIVPAAVLIASAAASSHDVLLVPMISVTLYTLMTLSLDGLLPGHCGAQLVLTRLTRPGPKLRALVSRKEAPENLWLKCPKCEQMLFMRDWEANQEVCTHCGHHMRIRPVKRLPHLFDEGKYQRIELPKNEGDPLKFRDRKRYSDRLRDAQAAGQPLTLSMHA